jgi:hypothetical protein
MCSIDAFTKLTKDIVDLSHEFTTLPIAPPSVSILRPPSLNSINTPQRVLAELPAGLPSMLNDTESSKLLRQAYVQHIISKYLCYRIFQPFLFSLGKRYDKADTFFQAMSNQLREKSTRKEAVWRHYTLLAGYTTSNAKKNQTVAAAQVIEEIAAYIKPFADPKKMDVVTSGITRIVKYAVETWRYARMEREIITASMSTDDADAECWSVHPWEQNHPSIASAVKQLEKTDGNAVVMALLPVFVREGTLPSLHRPNAVLDHGLVFSKGVALYADCAPVVLRKHELGLLVDVPDLEEADAARDAGKAEKEAEEAETAKKAAEERAAAAAAKKAAEIEAEIARIAAEEAEKARIAAEEAEKARIAAEEAEKARIATALEQQAREDLARAMADEEAQVPLDDTNERVTDEEAAAAEAAIEAAVGKHMAREAVESVVGGVEIPKGEFYLYETASVEVR